MKIIVMGCGRVGSQVSLLMAERGHDVTVIDHRDTDAMIRLGSGFKGRVINGLGFDEKVLLEAGIKEVVFDLEGDPYMFAEQFHFFYCCRIGSHGGCPAGATGSDQACRFFPDDLKINFLLDIQFP